MTATPGSAAYQPRTPERLIEILRAQSEHPRSWPREAADVIEASLAANAPDRAILSKHLTEDIADHILREWNDALHPIIRKYAGVEMLDGIWQELQEARRAHPVPPVRF